MTTLLELPEEDQEEIMGLLDDLAVVLNGHRFPIAIGVLTTLLAFAFESYYDDDATRNVAVAECMEHLRSKVN